jgi:hypothetical protein
MKRGMVLGSCSASRARTVKAQPPAATRRKVIEVEKVKDNLYVFRGANGGGQHRRASSRQWRHCRRREEPGWGKPILDKIKELTPKPVTTLINTHTHGDHVSGNVDFPATVDIVVQENTKTNMEKMPIFKEHNGAGMAKRTFKDKMTIGKGADQIDLYYFGPGHTNGDAIIVFPALRTAHTGDLFQGKALPLVDRRQRRQFPPLRRDARQSARGDQERRHDHQRPHATQTTWADLKTLAEFKPRRPHVGGVQD